MASSSNSDSASTSTSTADCYQYDVFINHRGPDVKETFARNLYNSLKAHGLRVFLDKEELQKGEKLICQIEGAIQTASVHIAIFSINYAHSNWCLDELVLMVESGSTILPVFFGVQPSELRWTEGEKGVYAQALRSLQNKRTSDSMQPRYDSETIGKWKKALYDVASISGFELEAYNGDEEKLLADVVERVVETVPKTPLDVSKYPTGLDDKVKDFEESVLWQPQKSGEARVVGIVGLGGVGKTTLAKEFFNRARTNYRRSCFLFDVREKVSRSSLNSLQSRLLTDLAQLKDVQINSTDEGIGKLRKHLSSFHALIILDDVDHLEQLEALISPAKDVLAPSSLILVTSRNKDILTSWGIGDLFIYPLKGLNSQHSTELFCSHAFHHPHPRAGFEQVVTEFLDACNGLPLSLRVLGALLHGKNDLEYWKAQLRKISKILPADIQKTLKISYDSLDEEEKQIFLDIACFFIGQNKDTAIRIWDGSGWEGSLGLQNLQNKCLVDAEVEKVENKYQLLAEVEGNWIDVESGGKECITMHDHLRDLGRDLAAKETVHRSWCVTNNLLDQSAVREIKNLADCSLADERRLHMFHGKGYCVDCVFSVGQQLVWLLWNYCAYSSLPSWIPVKDLRVLQIHRSDFKTLWQHEYQAPLQLRELHIVTARLVKIPESIGNLKHLEKVVLHPYQIVPIVPHQMHLKSLPDEYGQLQCLKHLELSKCSKMTSLPDSFWNLTNLEYINLSSCRGLKMLPDSFGNLTKLQHIDLAECKELQRLPNSFRNLIKLKFLSLRKCKQLTMSKETLGKITTLEYLSLSGCENIKVLPPQLTYQLFLRKLHLASDFNELPGAVGDLTNLKILSLGSSCLEMLPPSFGYLRSLEELELYFCPFICFPDSIRMLTQLKKLKKLRISVFENLEILEIKECSSRELRISVSENLEQLEMDECPSRELTFKNVGGEIEMATNSTGLQGALSKLDASEVTYPKVVFPNLQHLQIDQCDRLVEVGALPTTLTKLRLKDCPRLRKIGGLSTLAKLQTLHISCCKELEELLTLETLVSLEVLRAYECVNLKRIQGLAQLTKFQRLYINGCYELEELPGVEHLKTVDISRCPKLQWSEEEVERLRQQQSQPDVARVARAMAFIFKFVFAAAVTHGLSLIFGDIALFFQFVIVVAVLYGLSLIFKSEPKL